MLPKSCEDRGSLVQVKYTGSCYGNLRDFTLNSVKNEIQDLLTVRGLDGQHWHCTALPDSRGAQINRISIVESTIQDTSSLTTTTNQPHALLLIFKIRELLDLIEDFGSGSIFNTTETELNYFLVRTE